MREVIPLMPWTEWEDWKAGLYADEVTATQVDHSRALLADPEQFGEVAREMVRSWPVAAFHNLRHMWSGRNAWIGQASCLYAHGAPAAATRQAWGLLSNEDQIAANAVAVAVRTAWEREGYAQTLPWD